MTPQNAHLFPPSKDKKPNPTPPPVHHHHQKQFKFYNETTKGCTDHDEGRLLKGYGCGFSRQRSERQKLLFSMMMWVGLSRAHSLQSFFSFSFRDAKYGFSGSLVSVGGRVHPKHTILNFGLTSFFHGCSTYSISNSIVACLFPFSFHLFGCKMSFQFGTILVRGRLRV